MNSPILIVIGGPTGSGKTDLAIRLALHFGAEIISADSRQVYRELPIGTAAPDEAQLAQVKHHLIGHKSIHEPYNAGLFAREAELILESLFKLNPIQILVGGTGLYIKALLDGIDELPEVSPDIRTKVMDWYTSKGLSFLQEQLQLKDPVYAAQVDLENKARLIRALELIESSGKPYSALRTGKTRKRNFKVLYLLTDLPRADLYARINQRTNLMLDKGWLEETRNLLPYKSLKALQTVGYTELFAFLEGNNTWETTVELIQQNTRRYAKRQLTWFRNQTVAHEISPTTDVHVVEALLDQAV